MKADELKGKTEDELNKILADLRKEQLNQRFQKTAGQLDKTDKVRKTRRTIARVKTFLNEIGRGKTDAGKPRAKAPKAGSAKGKAKKAA